MKFVALFKGRGEGCDYTIACNKDFRVFDAENCGQAIEVCKKYWEDHGKSRGDTPVVDIDLYQLTGDKILVGIDVWNNLDAKAGLEEKVREIKRRHQEELDYLQR